MEETYITATQIGDTSITATNSETEEPVLIPENYAPASVEPPEEIEGLTTS